MKSTIIQCHFLHPLVKCNLLFLKHVQSVDFNLKKRTHFQYQLNRHKLFIQKDFR